MKEPSSSIDSESSKSDENIIDQEDFIHQNTQCVETKKEETKEQETKEQETKKEDKKEKKKIIKTGKKEINLDVLKQELSKKIKESTASKNAVEEQFTLVCNNRTYLEAIMKHSESVSSNMQVMPMIVHAPVSTAIANPKVILPENYNPHIRNPAFVRTKPMNPAVFRTRNGNRIEIPILEAKDIHPFIDIIAKWFHLDPSFNDFKTESANTRLKAAYEALKYLDVTQEIIDSILQQLY